MSRDEYKEILDDLSCRYLSHYLDCVIRNGNPIPMDCNNDNKPLKLIPPAIEKPQSVNSKLGDYVHQIITMILPCMEPYLDSSRKEGEMRFYFQVGEIKDEISNKVLLGQLDKKSSSIGINKIIEGFRERQDLLSSTDTLISTRKDKKNSRLYCSDSFIEKVLECDVSELLD